MDDEVKLASMARMIADPTRAKMLWSLMGGEVRPAGELALIATVSNQAASNHLAQLRSARMLDVEVRGRSHFYRLRNASVAKALEALMHLADPEANRVRGTAARAAPELMFARTCYDHLAGSVAVKITAQMKAKDWIKPNGMDFVVTAAGQTYLASLGIDLEEATNSRRRYAYPCLDWSERLDHIGGKLGALLLDWLHHRKAVARVRSSRAIRFTDGGRKLLEDAFGLRIGHDGTVVSSINRGLSRSQIS